jgi:hypothetical protein
MRWICSILWGSGKTRRKSALATAESCPAKDQPRPMDFSLDKHHIAWMELGQNGSFGEMLYTRLERLEAKLEIDHNLQILA